MKIAITLFKIVGLFQKDSKFWRNYIMNRVNFNFKIFSKSALVLELIFHGWKTGQV